MPAHGSWLNSYPDIGSVQKKLHTPESLPGPRGRQNPRLVNVRYSVSPIVKFRATRNGHLSSELYEVCRGFCSDHITVELLHSFTSAPLFPPPLHAEATPQSTCCMQSSLKSLCPRKLCLRPVMTAAPEESKAEKKDREVLPPHAGGRP